MEQTKAVSEVEGKEIAEVSDEELAQLMAKNSKLQENENAGEGVKADYILLAKTASKALKKKETELYIEGLAVGDFYLQREKVNLGSELKVVPLAFITLFDETDSTGSFRGTWNKEQAGQFPLVDGSYYNRQLPNGNILTPKNWVMVEVLGHPEIENAVICYKSTGSRIWKKWKEDSKTRSSSSATLVYNISEMDVENDKNSWTDIGFSYAESLLETDKAMAVKCLKKSNAIREAYENHILVANHDIASLSTKPVTAYIEDSEIEDSTDDEENGF